MKPFLRNVSLVLVHILFWQTVIDQNYLNANSNSRPTKTEHLEEQNPEGKSSSAGPHLSAANDSINSKNNSSILEKPEDFLREIAALKKDAAKYRQGFEDKENQEAFETLFTEWTQLLEKQKGSGQEFISRALNNPAAKNNLFVNNTQFLLPPSPMEADSVLTHLEQAMRFDRITIPTNKAHMSWHKNAASKLRPLSQSFFYSTQLSYKQSGDESAGGDIGERNKSLGSDVYDYTFDALTSTCKPTLKEGAACTCQLKKAKGAMNMVCKMASVCKKEFGIRPANCPAAKREMARPDTCGVADMEALPDNNRVGAGQTATAGKEIRECEKSPFIIKNAVAKTTGTGTEATSAEPATQTPPATPEPPAQSTTTEGEAAPPAEVLM